MNNNKKKILFITTSYPRFKNDYAGSFLEVLVNKLQNDFDITVLAPDDIAVKAENKEIIRFKYFFHKKFHKLTYSSGIPENLDNNWLSSIQIPFLLVSLSNSIHMYCKDKNLIITNWLIPTGLCGAIISKVTKKPHLIIEHSAGTYWLNKLPFKKVIANFISKYSTIIFVSPHLKSTFEDILGHKLDYSHIIPMGVDVKQFSINIPVDISKSKLNIPIKNKILLFLGRLEKIKGLDTLIKSLKGIENTTLLVAGEGQKRNYYEHLSTKNHLDVRFLGIQTGFEKIELLKMCDLVIVPSIIMPDGRTEGIPVVIMEALACGKPVIASNTGGIPFIIKDNVNGKLFKPSDYNELNQILKHIFQHKHFYYKLSEGAKTFALNYHSKKIAQNYIEVIKQLI